jgi:hypothetical protein
LPIARIVADSFDGHHVYSLLSWKNSLPLLVEKVRRPMELPCVACENHEILISEPRAEIILSFKRNLLKYLF